MLRFVEYCLGELSTRTENREKGEEVLRNAGSKFRAGFPDIQLLSLTNFNFEGNSVSDPSRRNYGTLVRRHGNRFKPTQDFSGSISNQTSCGHTIIHEVIKWINWIESPLWSKSGFGQSKGRAWIDRKLLFANIVISSKLDKNHEI